MAEEKVVTESRPVRDFGTLLLSIPLIAVLSSLLFFLGTSLLETVPPGVNVVGLMISQILGFTSIREPSASPMLAVEMLVFIILPFLVPLATAVAVTLEIKAAKKNPSKKVIENSPSPLVWFFLTVFFWIVAYPYYLYRRSQFGYASRWVAGVAIALIFIASLVVPRAFTSEIHMFSSTDIVLLSRIAAHVFPDVMRNVCKNQSEDTRRKLEGALNSAGLINIRESDICNDSECQRMSGDDNVKRDQKTIKSIIEISRSMLISAYSQESSEVLARYCNQTIKKIENVKSNKPEKMIEELALN